MTVHLASRQTIIQTAQMQFCVSVVQFERLSFKLSALVTLFMLTVAVGIEVQHGNFSDVCTCGQDQG